MMETKPGTRWVGKGEGATTGELYKHICFLEINKAGRTETLLHLRGIGKRFTKKTNLALTGEPLTDEDLKRIAECE